MTTFAQTPASAPSAEQPEAPFPFAVTDPKRVPAERYYATSFAELEKDRLWTKAWQFACRLDEIPRPGDFTEYNVAGQSILIVHTSDEKHPVKAYFNACRHRATALGEGTGTFYGEQIVCPYHGWRWNLDGESTYVYAKKGFSPACLDPEFLKLRECQVGTLFGFVFINMDHEAAPLAEEFADIAETLAPIGFDRMTVRWWRSVKLNANWKMAQEAFLEAYHVMQAHPSLSMGAADDDYDLEAMSQGFETFPGGHAHALPPGGLESPVKGMGFGDYFIQFNNALYVGTDAYTTEREMFIQQGLMERDLPDEQVPLAFFGALYEYAQGAGINLPPPAGNTSGYAHVFPNLTFLPAYGNSIAYRVRPDDHDPESCHFEVWALQIPNAEDAEPDRPVCEVMNDVEDWPQIFKEDFRNVHRQQKGVRTQGLDDLLMSETYEAMIVNSHATIDKYLRSSK